MSMATGIAVEQQLAARARPAGRVVMRQTWERLLFLHWRFPPRAVQSRLPAGLTVDTFDGSAWLGVVPFQMRNIRLSGWPPVPGTANFLELNLRTCVRDSRGTPGVWFFSLDASSWLAVQTARRWFCLPYWWSRMSAVIDPRCERVDYRSHRRGTDPRSASHLVYQPRGNVRRPPPGSLEFFLIERYVLFAETAPGRLAEGRVHHAPYEIADAHLESYDDRLLSLNGFPAVQRACDHAVVCRGVEVDVYPLQPIAPRPK